MLVDKYKKHTVSDFLNDEDFIRWRLLKNDEDSLFWSNFKQTFPESIEALEEASEIFDKVVILNDYVIPEKEVVDLVSDLEYRIVEKKKRRKVKLWTISVSAVAASVAILFGLSLFVNNRWIEQDITKFANSIDKTEELYSGETKLVLSETSTVLLDNNESIVEYSEEGIKADSNHIVAKEDVAEFNQLITPYGKRSTIVFQDGTKAYVNAGSRLIYPTKFEKNKREIFLDGEIYIEVAEDKSRPFI
ncbi:MAG: FecR domain-containing protein, partial [Fermentimonas sp.]